MLAHNARLTGSRIAVLFGLSLSSGWAFASPTLLQIQVNAVDVGAPLEDVVVTARLPGYGLQLESARPSAVVEQIDQQFDPQLLIIKTGTAVEFPNRDQTRHHVYSFSNAKTFEIRLYKGLPAEPVLFDVPGPVILGCNIHDQMRAFIYVTDTDFWGRTDALGQAGLIIPESEAAVTLEFWHPRLRGDSVVHVLERPLPNALAVSLDVRPALPQHRPPESSLQQRFEQMVK